MTVRILLPKKIKDKKAKSQAKSRQNHNSHSHTHTHHTTPTSQLRYKSINSQTACNIQLEFDRLKFWTATDCMTACVRERVCVSCRGAFFRSNPMIEWLSSHAKLPYTFRPALPYAFYSFWFVSFRQCFLSTFFFFFYYVLHLS